MLCPSSRRLKINAANLNVPYFFNATNNHQDEVGEQKRMELILLLENTSWDETMKQKVAIKISAITTSEQYQKALRSINQNQNK